MHTGTFPLIRVSTRKSCQRVVCPHVVLKYAESHQTVAWMESRLEFPPCAAVCILHWFLTLHVSCFTPLPCRQIQITNFSVAMGCGILTTYAEIANIAGIHGLLTYTIVGAIPIFLFSFFGPMIRRRCQMALS